jgi:hypothetical protein
MSVPTLHTTEAIELLAGALLRGAKEIGAEPTFESVAAAGGDTAEWACEAICEVPGLGRLYGMADFDGKCELDDTYLGPALQLAAKAPAADDCTDCGNTRVYGGFRGFEEPCRTCCGNNSHAMPVAHA